MHNKCHERKKIAGYPIEKNRFDVDGIALENAFL